MNLYDKRFAEIAKLTDDLAASKTTMVGHYGEDEDIEYEAFKTWLVRTEALISDACGSDSKHLQHFLASQKGAFANTWDRFAHLRPIFLAAKADFDGGYFNKLRSLVQSELLSDELDQARELLDKGYKTPAAVIAGVVLESSLRQLCDKNSLPHGKLDNSNLSAVLTPGSRGRSPWRN